MASPSEKSANTVYFSRLLKLAFLYCIIISLTTDISFKMAGYPHLIILSFCIQVLPQYILRAVAERHVRWDFDWVEKVIICSFSTRFQQRNKYFYVVHWLFVRCKPPFVSGSRRVHILRRIMMVKMSQWWIRFNTGNRWSLLNMNPSYPAIAWIKFTGWE